jgi:hypothetical protein
MGTHSWENLQRPSGSASLYLRPQHGNYDGYDIYGNPIPEEATAYTGYAGTGRPSAANPNATEENGGGINPSVFGRVKSRLEYYINQAKNAEAQGNKEAAQKYWEAAQKWTDSIDGKLSKEQEEEILAMYG